MIAGLVDTYLHQPTGPEFLAWYFMWSAGAMIVTLLAGNLALRSVESPRRPVSWGGDLADPYEIAYLRGGFKEAVIAALITLDKREYLKIEADTVKPMRSETNLHPVESAVLAAAAPEANAYELIADPKLEANAETWTHQASRKLQKLGLLYTDDLRFKLNTLMAAGLALALAPGLYRLLRGIYLGRQVLFLVGMIVLVAAAGYWLCRAGRTTEQGRDLLARLKKDFSFLEDGWRREMPLSTPDMLIAAGLFGLSAGFLGSLGASQRLRSALAAPRDTSPGANCGIGCGSSCGGGCGGGCGCGG